MKIIGIVGILDFQVHDDRLWTNLRESFAHELPGVQFHVARTFYLPWQRAKRRTLGEHVVASHDDGEDIVLLGYSLGGYIARTIAADFKKSKVRMMATIATPHYFYGRSSAHIPVISFAGVFDLFIPYMFTGADGVVRVALRSDHLFSFWLSRTPSDEVARKLRMLLYPTPAPGA